MFIGQSCCTKWCAKSHDFELPYFLFSKNRTFRLLLNPAMRISKQTTSFFFLFLMVLVLGSTGISCKEKKRPSTEKDHQQEKELLFSKELEIPNDQIIHLLPKAKKETSKWLAYITAQAEIKRFENFTVQDAADHAEDITQIMERLGTTVPKIFHVKPVLSRINVLVTLSNVLKQMASNPQSTAEEIEMTAEKIPVAFRNLKIQLNEVFRKGLKDFQAELEETDTIKREGLKVSLPRT